MTRARTGKRSARTAPGSDPLGQGPSLLNGMRGLSRIAGNQAMIGVLARRQGPGAWEDAEDTLEDASAQEGALAELRVGLDEFDKLMKAVDDGDANAYAQLRAWVQRVLAALHAALEATDDYDGDLADELEAVKRLPEDQGRHRLQALAELAKLLQAEGEKAHAHLSKQLPAMGAPRADTLSAGSVGAGLVERLRRGLAKQRRAVEADREPDGPERLAAAAGGLGLGRPGRRRKRKAAGAG